MTSLLLSALAREFRESTLESFQAAYPHCWLVWEPGMWRPPGKEKTTLTALRMPTPMLPAGEALALALTPKRGSSGQVTLGRASSSDIEINDGTLSHVHLLLMEDSSSRWTVRDVGSKNGTWLDEVPLSPGEPRLLSNGARILAAHVCLTFYEPIGLLGRLGTSPSTAPPRSQAPSAK